MSLLDRIRAWWGRDTVERAAEESRDDASPIERDVDRQEFEGRRADLAAQEHLGERGVNFERDSERPRDH